MRGGFLRNWGPTFFVSMGWLTAVGMVAVKLPEPGPVFVVLFPLMGVLILIQFALSALEAAISGLEPNGSVERKLLAKIDRIEAGSLIGLVKKLQASQRPITRGIFIDKIEIEMRKADKIKHQRTALLGNRWEQGISVGAMTVAGYFVTVATAASALQILSQVPTWDRFWLTAVLVTLQLVLLGRVLPKVIGRVHAEALLGFSMARSCIMLSRWLFGWVHYGIVRPFQSPEKMERSPGR